MASSNGRLERLAVYTTVYPAAERFLPEWYASVRAQTDPEFDLCIGLDGITPERVASRLDSDRAVQWFRPASVASPTQVRAGVLKRLVRAYDAIVLVDSDDVLQPDRVAAARVALQSCDVSACALRLIDEEGRVLEAVLQPPRGLGVDQLLPQYNVFGLSNTAYRAEALARCLPVPDDCVLVDWFLATRAWLAGAKLEFDPEPRMRYRQYSDNMAVVRGPFSAAEVARATHMVLGHYRAVLRDQRAIPARLAAIAEARDRVERFHRAISGSGTLLMRYVAALNELAPTYVWWWCVGHPDLESVWKA